MRKSITLTRVNWVDVAIFAFIWSTILFGNEGGSTIGIACAAVLTFCVISFLSVARYRVSWSDGLVEVFRRPLGRQETKWDQITAIQEDYLAYHLFSTRDQVVISKATAPRDLLEALATLHNSRAS